MKKLKGHTVIELKDIVTGEVEKIESDNLVTNAVQEFLSLWQPLIGWGGISKYFTPLWRNFFSGIYLFDTAQVESASNTFLPNAATAKLVGYAGDAATDGNDTKRGSFNFNESEELVNGYKFVWDFGTSEANGTIASLSLTNPVAGYHGYHYHPSRVLYGGRSYTGNIPTNYKGMGWESTSSTDPIININTYAIRAYEDSNNSYKSQIYDFSILPQEISWKSCCPASDYTRYHAGKIKINDIDLNSVYGVKEFVNETISNPGQAYTSACLSFDTGTEIISVWISNDSVLYVNKYNRTTFVLTDSYNTSIYTATGKYVRGFKGQTAAGAAYRNGYLYFIGYDYNDAGNQGYVIRFNVSTKEAVVLTPKFTITVENSTQNHAFVFEDVNGNIYAGGYVIDNNDDYIENDLATSGGSSGDWYGYVPNKYAYMQIAPSVYTYIIPNLQYLATINNLASPVIKTASKVMKITYTLTEAT